MPSSSRTGVRIFLRVASAFLLFLAAVGPAQSYAGQGTRQVRLDGSSDRAPADTLSELRGQYLLELPSTLLPRAVGLPGSSLSTPTAYGAVWGDVYAVAVYQERVRYADLSDGAVGAGVGFGDPEKMLGVELNFASYNLFMEGEEDQRDVSVSFKVHRALTHSTRLAIGVEHATRLHGRGGDGGRSAYVVASRTTQLRQNVRDPFSVFTASLGIGTGRFRSERQILEGSDRPNIFASAGVRVVRAVSVIADWTGQDLNAGLAIRPFSRLPLVATIGVADVTGHAGDGARVIGGFGFGMHF